MNKRIPLTAIYGNPDQPRKTFDERELKSLAASIVENGLKQPITVRADADGRYMIVMGERRFRAHQVIDVPGFDTILCHVSKVDDAQLGIDAIIENDQRVDVTPLEQAFSYQRMIDLHGFTHETLAKKLGKHVHRITERTDLLKLNETAQQLLKSEQITATDAWYLSKLEGRKQTLLLRAINAGQCKTTTQLKAVFEAIRDADAQSALFEMPVDEPTVEERRIAKTFEDKIEAVAALLRSSVVDNDVVAVRKVSRDRLGAAADLMAAMQIDLARIETAFRVGAAGVAISQEG